MPTNRNWIQLQNNRVIIEDNVEYNEDNFRMAMGSPDNMPGCDLDGAPDGWFPPGPKEGWEYQVKVKENQNAVPHDSLDNPGGWSNYPYHRKFAGVGEHRDCNKHEMPAGARPVPINEETGKRTSGDWDFFYKGWQ